MLSLTAFLVLAETPEKTVQTFVDAFNARDAAAMARQVVGQKPTTLSLPPNFFNIQATFGATKIAGDTATVQVDLTVSGMAPNSQDRRVHEAVILRNVNGDWQIVPVDLNSKGTSDASNPQPLATFAMLVTNPQVMAQAKQTAKKSSCLSNVKQLALSTMLYVVDHNERYPKSATWKASVSPYVKNEAIFHCPDDPSGGTSYFFEPRLSGLKEVTSPWPAETAMIVEGANGKAVFRHGGLCAIGYADGHAKMLKPAQVLAARTKKLK